MRSEGQLNLISYTLLGIYAIFNEDSEKKRPTFPKSKANYIVDVNSGRCRKVNYNN